ncbi:ADP-ribosylglycohydrolase family protein [Zophobihabitans entericus]|uniref:ADP-ribosylglycohydrolase family protein n=1 Tax=Zophobihabitans entericus TaxID=1635327 RepID=A0A6G9I933_9GAMM|nr:ADP-ribosylglycohydrolase family protein [Zophobihabitans entericus]QIQ20731.1 ADP-ribosylglycohydrolase family protein [Zophobihabitans entericus]
MKNTQKKILGCLYGQAIGDAMGMPSELLPRYRLHELFGEITGFLPGHAKNPASSHLKRGEFTDDTHQAIALIKAITECNGEIVPTIIAQHILHWAQTNDAFNTLGPTSKHTLLSLQKGEALENIKANGVTNGAAMRISPVGCLLSSNNPSFIDGVAQACYATHKSDIAIAGAAVIAKAISRIIDGYSWQEIKPELLVIAHDVQTKYRSTFSPSLSLRIKYAFEVAQQLKNKPKDLALNELYNIIGAGMDTIESVPTALAIVDITLEDPMMTALYCANLGGDTDTIGAIATAICGTIHGIDAFPPEAIQLINDTNKINFADMANSLTQLRFKIGTV